MPATTGGSCALMSGYSIPLATGSIARLYPTAQTKLARMRRIVVALKSKNVTMSARCELTMTTSAASSATSVPAPSAMPRWAWARAALSLIPSPTKATVKPSACSSSTTRTLSCGSCCAYTSVGRIPTRPATSRAAASLSPVTMTIRRCVTLDPVPTVRSAASADAASGLIVSSTASTAQGTPSREPATTVRPRLYAAWMLASGKSRKATFGDTGDDVLFSPLPSARVRGPLRARSSTNRREPRAMVWSGPSAPSFATRKSSSTPPPGVTRTWPAALIRRPTSPSDRSPSQCCCSAVAIGCDEPASAAATAAATACWSRRASSERTASALSHSTLATRNLPIVSVPVLSKSTQSTLGDRSSASPAFTSTPRRAPMPVPTMTAVGVASPRAHGHATTIVARKKEKAKTSGDSWSPRHSFGYASDCPSAVHTRKTRMAKVTTTGTKTDAALSATRWIDGLADCARRTMRNMFASIVSSPTRRASTMMPCVRFIVPPTTASPTPRSMGYGSPVTMLSSSAVVPSTTTPSTGTREPTSTLTLAPRGIVALFTVRSVPSSATTMAVGGVRLIKDTSASPVSRFA
mmetsp:Transcript_11782/g.36632  ORF Transcript_11782/g.36632 Transcript_11782/m.36632 type:complete len:579 (-) Transcript_11782:1022-2758(-)